jgi:hypothetical protein
MNRAFLSLAIALLITGCAAITHSPKVVAIAYDPGDLQRVEKSRTYHWSLPGASEINPYNNQDIYLALVKTDIDAQLAKKGYKLVASGGDLEVSFLLLNKEGATTTVADQYFGTNRAPERKILHLAKKLPDPKYEVGTLLVDAEDAHDHESLWRGAVSARVDRSKPYETQKARIESGIALLMSQFPAAK